MDLMMTDLAAFPITLRWPRAAKVLAIEIEKVEDIINQPLHPIPSQAGIQGIEIRDPFLGWDHDLADQDRRLYRISGKCLRQGSKTPRPIIAAARIERDSALLEVSLGPVAVILNFMEPFGAAWISFVSVGRQGCYVLRKRGFFG